MRIYRRVARAAEHPAGGIPEGWALLGLEVHGDYHPHRGQWWQAAAAYTRCDQSTGTRRLIGAGPSVHAALVALERRLADPFRERRHDAMGGWDPRHQPGRVVDHP